MRSALYPGVVVHRRHADPAHTLRFRGLWLYLDLDEWDEALRGRWLWGADRRALLGVRRRDHLGGAEPLAEVVRARVEAQTGVRPEGPVALLTMPRFAGLGFNPVSFFYCWSRDAARLEAVVAEVTNTPWHERHVYVLPAEEAGAGEERPLRALVPKTFHVSPFLPMDLTYRFRVRPPGARLGLGIEVLRAGRPVLDARLALRRREIGGRELAAALPRAAFQPARALGAIYVHALRLFLKRAPFHAHPTSTPRAPARVSR